MGLSDYRKLEETNQRMPASYRFIVCFRWRVGAELAKKTVWTGAVDPLTE